MKIGNLNYAILDQCLISGTNFLLSIILARVLPPSEFGLYIFAFTILVVSVGFMNSIITSPLSVLGAPVGKETWNKFLYVSLVMFFSVSILLMIILFTSYFCLKESIYHLNASVLGVVGMIVLLYIGQEFVRRALLTRLKVRHAFIIDMITYLTRLLMILLFVYLEDIDCTTIIYIFGFTSLFGIISGLYSGDLTFKVQEFRFDYSILREFWNYSKWTLAEWIPFVLSGQLYIFIVTFVLGNDATGILGACRNLIAPLSILLIGIMNFALPYYSNVNKTSGEKILKQSLRGFFTVLFTCVMIYLFIINCYAEQFLYFLFGKYSIYANIVFLYSVGIFFNFVFKPADIYLRVVMKPKLVFISRLIAGAVCALSCYPMVLFFGIEGAVYTYILSQVIMCIFLFNFIFGDGLAKIKPKKTIILD